MSAGEIVVSSGSIAPEGETCVVRERGLDIVGKLLYIYIIQTYTVKRYVVNVSEKRIPHGTPPRYPRRGTSESTSGRRTRCAGLTSPPRRARVLGVLGPNGAGKTTAVRILTTLLQPDAGHAEVAGLDVVRHADELRARIGLAGQYAAVDELLTGRENLEMFGRLYHVCRQRRPSGAPASCSNAST